MATLSALRTRLDRHANRTDSDYTVNRDFFLNSGLRWIQETLLREVGLDAVWTNAVDVVAGVREVTLPETTRPSSKTRLFRLDGTDRIELRRIPEAWLEDAFFDVDTGTTIDLTDPTVQGVPAYFAIRGRTLQIRPAAQQAYTLELHGLCYVPDLVNASDQNVFTVEAEDLCLYAGLRACWLFFEDQGRMDFWERRAKEAALAWASTRVEEASADRPLAMETFG